MNERVSDSAGVTPMMAQYLEIKSAHPDCLLFYRMGDFYELFFEDAEVASRALGITLTRRGRHLGDDIPMCGVPVHAAGDYLERLIRQGHRVAVCEQVEDPAEARRRGSKAVVRREVVRLVTAGTLTEDTLLDARRHNYLAAVARVRAADELAVAWADISTGDLGVTRTEADALATELARLEPREILVADSLLSEPSLRSALDAAGAVITPLPPSHFDSTAGDRRLRETFAVRTLDAYGEFGRAETAALGALLGYITVTQAGSLPALRPPVREHRGDTMLIDAATRANLELEKTLHGERRGSLLATIDRTVTGAGGRLLAERLSSPLTDPARIGDRLDAVGYLLELRDQRRRLREMLAGVPDLERALARLTVGRGGPRDLAAIRDGLTQARDLAGILAGEPGLLAMPAEIAAVREAASRDDGGLAAALRAALADELPLLARDGGFVRPGHSGELDDQRRLRDDSRKVIAGLQARYAEQTGLRSLKVRHNNVLGYFVELPAQHAERLMSPPNDAVFFHRQTLANAMRFSTAELAELEAKIAASAGRAVAIELEVFGQLVERVREAAGLITSVARALATLDVYAALAELAEEAEYVRPKVDDSLAFRIVRGRHPVVEQALRRSGEGGFIPNDCDLTADDPDDGGGGRRLWLLTGPNMAGKSTFLRQNALIAILAQAGSYVPAAAAHIGIVDRLFSRVGAADDLARGRSTFMVEMVETATILHQAGPRSLVILDEIGRGTATFDGLSIAWASIEHLHEVNRCRALFATHFHELTALAERLPQLFNATMRVKEWQGEVVFLHEVTPGAADRSYGIQVARLAGLPAAVVARAGEVLKALEQDERSTGPRNIADDLPLFAAARPHNPLATARDGSAIERRLAEILPDELTPREALEVLYELKALVADG